MEGQGRVVHCKRAEYDVYIGRPSKWGNPYVIGRDGDRAEVIGKYEEWLKGQPGLMDELADLHGLVLGCWCSPAPCHGEVLVRLAEGQAIDYLRHRVVADLEEMDEEGW